MTKKQVYWEDIEMGQQLPTLVKHPTTKQIVMWCGAADEYTLIHYDKDVALQMNLPGVIVPGRFTFSCLSQLVTTWMGDEGSLKKLGESLRGMHVPGEDLICKGKISNKYVKDAEHYVELEVWAENIKGEKTAPGSALVVLPSKAN